MEKKASLRQQLWQLAGIVLMVALLLGQMKQFLLNSPLYTPAETSYYVERADLIQEALRYSRRYIARETKLQQDLLSQQEYPVKDQS